MNYCFEGAWSWHSTCNWTFDLALSFHWSTISSAAVFYRAVQMVLLATLSCFVFMVSVIRICLYRLAFISHISATVHLPGHCYWQDMCQHEITHSMELEEKKGILKNIVKVRDFHHKQVVDFLTYRRRKHNRNKIFILLLLWRCLPDFCCILFALFLCFRFVLFDLYELLWSSWICSLCLVVCSSGIYCKMSPCVALWS